MTISDFFSSFFQPKTPIKCQPSHQQRRQNQNFSSQILKLDLQSIKKEHGRLDQRYEKVIDGASLQSAYRVQKYMKQIRTQLQKVDHYCTNADSRKYNNKQQCVQEMDSLILEDFQKPFIKGQLNLYKVANHCLINGGTQGNCIEEVKKQSFKSFDQGLKNLKNLVNNKCS